MKYLHKTATIFLLMFLVTGNVQAQENRTLETKVADILAQYPTKNNEAANQLAQKIIDLGESGIVEFADMLIPQGEGDDTQVRYAFQSLVNYSAAPKHETDRVRVEKLLLIALDKTPNDEVKSFLIRRLSFCASDISNKAMEKLLSNEALYLPAIGVLTNIGTANAGETLLKGIKNTNAKREIIKALGVIKYHKAVPVLTELTASANTQISKEALYSLAKIASPESKITIAKAIKNSKLKIAVEYARNLGLNGNKELSVVVCREIIKNTKSEDRLHIRSAAYSILRDNLGNKITSELIKEAKKTKNKQYRKALFNHANKGMTAEEVKSWLRIFKKFTDEGKLQFLNSFAHRKEKSILTKLILPTLKSKNKDLRIEAIKTLAIHQREKAVPKLVEILKDVVSDDEESQAIYQALYRTISAQSSNLLVSEFNDLSIASKKISLQLLAAKKATQYFNFVHNLTETGRETIQTEAYKTLPNISSAENVDKLILLLDKTQEIDNVKQVQAALSVVVNGDNDTGDKVLKAFETGMSKLKLLPVFPSISSKKALEYLELELKNNNEIISAAAIDALILWKDEDAIPYIFHIISKGNRSVQKAFDAYLSNVNSSNLPADQKLLLIKKLVPFAKPKNPFTKSNSQITQIINAAGEIKTFLSLVFVSEYMEVEAFSQAAMEAASLIIKPELGMKNTLSGKFVREIIIKIINNMEGGQYVKIDLRKILDKMPDEEGYVSIFNGKDFTGWEGLVENPIRRSKMSKIKLDKAQAKANKQMLKDWFVKDGIIVFKGEGNNISTIKDYGDFEMLVDWRITNGGDSGIYLRGTPQVQIWDTARTDVGAQVGSGGLYNNQKHQSMPLVVADNPLNEWNTFRIKMVGDRVTVHLNGILVTNNVIFENYWDRNLPIFVKESIELQAHGENLGFRNIYVREIKSENYGLTEEEKNDGFVSLFNGKNLDYWVGNKTDYLVEENILAVRPKQGGHGNLYTASEYSDFIFRFEFQLTLGANNGLGIHTPLNGDAAYVGKELQILDNTASSYKNLKPYQYHGSVYGVIAAKRGYLKPVGEWNSQEVIVKGDHIKITLNGTVILEDNMKEASKNGTADHKDHPGLKRNKGHIGFLGHGSELQFRHIRIKDLSR